MDDDKSCFRIQVILQIENALFFPNSYKISSTVWVKIDIFFPYWKRINPFSCVPVGTYGLGILGSISG